MAENIEIVVVSPEIAQATLSDHSNDPNGAVRTIVEKMQDQNPDLLFRGVEDAYAVMMAFGPEASAL